MKGVEKMKPSHNLLALFIESIRKVRFYKTYVRNDVIMLGYVALDRYGSYMQINITRNICVISICRTPTWNFTATGLRHYSGPTTVVIYCLWRDKNVFDSRENRQQIPC